MSEAPDPSVDEQAAFSAAHDLQKQMVARGLGRVDVAKGIFVAAISALRKSGMSNEQIAALLYEYADDYAVRDFEGKKPA